MKLPMMSMALALAALLKLPGVGSAQAGADAMQTKLELIGGTYRMFALGVEPVSLRLTVGSANGQAQQVQVRLWAEDVFARPLRWERRLTLALPANGASVERDMPFSAGAGYFKVWASLDNGHEQATRSVDLGVVRPPHPGLRPESFFASNTSGLRRGQELRLLQLLGLKVQRVHFQPRPQNRPPATPAGALPLDFREQDAAWNEARAHDTWALPIVGYAFENAKSPLAEQTGMHGPPRDDAEFIATWEQILRHYPEISTYEFWNEPWIFGWTWAADAASYRRLQKAWCEMALRVNPRLRLIAGNSSMFTEDHIEPDPASWLGLLQGTTHHPYSYSTGQATLRAGDVGRSIDHGALVTRRMGLPFYYLTEGGTEYAAPPVPEQAALQGRRATLADALKVETDAAKKADLQSQAALLDAALAQFPDARNNNANAYKIVQYFVRAALCGAYMGNAQWDIGYGPNWTKSNVALATMTQFLEDRPVVADIWPRHELIWGAIFSNPRFVTPAVRKLPRAAELATRWRVPVPLSRITDATKVAVLWSNTGPSNEEVDTDGTLTIEDATGLAAYDLTGREIPSTRTERGPRLTVPFNEHPVYITTDQLDVMALRERLANARIERVTPVNCYALSLLRPANQAQTLGVRVENQLNRDVSGRLFVRLLGSTQATEASFAVGPGRLIEVPVPWPGSTLAPLNQYGLVINARTDAGTVTRQQIVAVAHFARRSITVDGTLADWGGATPVTLDSDQLRSGLDLTKYLLNPHLDRPTGTPEQQRVVARVFTAYDGDNVYLAAAVNEDRLASKAGQPATRGRSGTKVELPYRQGVPEGLDHIKNCGDVFSFGFGFRERVPGWGRQPADPYSWKGQFYDTDYHYVAHVSTDGPQLVRQWGPGTGRRAAYQTEAVPGYGAVPGAQIAIARDEAAKLTVYEIAIPRHELTMFDPVAERCRFGFQIVNDEGVGEGNALHWAQAAGVFDHWRSAGSFGPSWNQVLPCQTFFGIEP